MNRWLTTAAGLALLVALTATVVSADDPPGAKLYSTYCVACHGTGGKGGFAPAIGSDAYLEKAKDEEIQQITAEGTAKGMPAWGKAKGGTLTDEQIADIVSYLRSMSSAGTATAAATPVPTAVAVQVIVPTTLTLAQNATPEGQFVVSAALKDDGGKPVAGETVAFARETMLGPLSLGTAKTDSTGTAKLVLDQVPENSQITAAFKANKNWQAARAELQLDSSVLAASAGYVAARNVRLDVDEPLLAPEGSLVTPNPPLIPAILFLLVVAGIWSIYVFVISQIVGIWKDRPKTVRENQLRMRTR